MSSIVIAGDTSGSVTLQAPAVSGSTVLNLPATSGTIQASGAGYTTNGVAFASSTSVLATGSALVFDGTNLGVGGSPANVINAKSATQYKGVQVNNATNTIAELIGFNASNEAGGLKLYNAGSPIVQILSDGTSFLNGGNVGIGTSSPSFASGGGLAIFNASAARLALKCNATGANNGFQLGIDTSGIAFIEQRENAALLFATNSTERARIDSSGNLLVGTTSSFSARLGVKDSTSNGTTSPIVCKNSSDTTLFYVSSNGYFVTGTGGNSPYNLTTASASNVTIESDGVLKRSTSSLKYKTDVKDATHGLAEVLQLRPVTYKGKNDGNKVFGGLIAEEIHEVGLTEFVQYAEDGTPDALAYGNMVSLCVKAIQEQQALITQLTERITALEAN
jgi:hypothetical protein